MIKVSITKKVFSFFKYKKILQKISDLILKNEKITTKSEVNLIIVNNKTMQKISNQYKQKNAPTDVLSFPADWKSLAPLIGYNMFGDIYISKDKIKEQAKKYGHSYKREWCYLFAHGFLHLLGYDHQNAIEEKVMHQKSESVLQKLGVKR